VQGEQVFDVGPALDAVAIDWRVLGFAAALAVVTVALFGLIPSVVAARMPSSEALSQSGRATRQGHRLRATLVGVQLTLAVTLLAGAGVLGRSLQNLRRVDLGMATDHVVSFGLTTLRLGYRGERADALVADTLDRLRRAPGVESVAFAVPSPFWRGYSPASLKARPVEDSPAHRASCFTVTADYFRTLQIPLRAGRTFVESDRRSAKTTTGIGIVSESLARQLFGEASPVGRRIYQSESATGWKADRTIEIVGVVGDTRSGVDLRASGRAVLYEPSGSMMSGPAFFVRSPLATADVLATVRATLREIDPALPITEAGAVQDAVDRLLPEDRVLALLVGGVALIAMLLGVAGVHAVTANSVAERTREFGIRLALGASRRAVSSGVLRGLAVVAACGLVGGLALFAALSRLLASRVYGISPTDPITLAAVSALLVLAALAGAWTPARRATRVDPAIALRAE
jgi:predicted permease